MSRGGRDLDISNNERTFLLQALKEGYRLDGRAPDAARPLSLSYGPDFGSVELSLGDTRVLATVTAEIIRPYPESPGDGQLMFSAEVSPISTGKRDRGRISEEEMLLNRMLERCLKRSRAVDTEGLCIVAGANVWGIRVTAQVISNEGNLVDAVCTAALVALMHFRRPDVTVVDGEVVVHGMQERTPLPLSVHFTPICTTFSLFRGVGTVLVDPTVAESRVQSGELMVCMNAHREICTIAKSGGLPSELSTLLRCSKLAAERASKVSEMIRQSVQQDVKLKIEALKVVESMHGRKKGDERPGV
ncbi:ribosomal protein S5 domain 2-type protein [Hyaloraphidium curvatum]|nr:ribosomal protein S5 domain 2-type protein [Hyaloraphidium curvatum]